MNRLTKPAKATSNRSLRYYPSCSLHTSKTAGGVAQVLGTFTFWLTFDDGTPNVSYHQSLELDRETMHDAAYFALDEMPSRTLGRGSPSYLVTHSKDGPNGTTSKFPHYSDALRFMNALAHEGQGFMFNIENPANA